MNSLTKKKEHVSYIEIDRKDVFRVPLMWMMPDSEVDVYVLEKQVNENGQEVDVQTKIPLLNNIGKAFSKTAGDLEKDDLEKDFESKLIKLNNDFYVSMDIQAYSCLPKASIDTNPLQYVLSFNPPVMIKNYCMNPVSISEIQR